MINGPGSLPRAWPGTILVSEGSICAHPSLMSDTTPARRSGRMSRDRSTPAFTGHADERPPFASHELPEFNWEGGGTLVCQASRVDSNLNYPETVACGSSSDLK
jgi:hypothetical protein